MLASLNNPSISSLDTNLLEKIAGIALLTFGTSAFMTLHELQVSPSGSFEDVKTITYYGAISFLVVGAILSIIGVCGCCGALTESQCLLMTVSMIEFTLSLTHLSSTHSMFCSVYVRSIGMFRSHRKRNSASDSEQE